jgi:hypothetical protein
MQETLDTGRNHLVIFKIYPKSGHFIVETMYDKMRAFHCRHCMIYLTVLSGAQTV